MSLSSAGGRLESCAPIRLRAQCHLPWRTNHLSRSSSPNEWHPPVCTSPRLRVRGRCQCWRKQIYHEAEKSLLGRSKWPAADATKLPGRTLRARALPANDFHHHRSYLQRETIQSWARFLSKLFRRPGELKAISRCEIELFWRSRDLVRRALLLRRRKRGSCLEPPVGRAEQTAPTIGQQCHVAPANGPIRFHRDLLRGCSRAELAAGWPRQPAARERKLRRPFESSGLTLLSFVSMLQHNLCGNLLFCFDLCSAASSMRPDRTRNNAELPQKRRHSNLFDEGSQSLAVLSVEEWGKSRLG